MCVFLALYRHVVCAHIPIHVYSSIYIIYKYNMMIVLHTGFDGLLSFFVRGKAADIGVTTRGFTSLSFLHLSRGPPPLSVRIYRPVNPTPDRVYRNVPTYTSVLYTGSVTTVGRFVTKCVCILLPRYTTHRTAIFRSVLYYMIFV